MIRLFRQIERRARRAMTIDEKAEVLLDKFDTRLGDPVRYSLLMQRALARMRHADKVAAAATASP
jgi:hypothetical protein